MSGAIGFIGAGLSLAGGLYSSISQQQMVAKQTAYSEIAENTRQQQMQLEAQRQRRQAVREAIAARSVALTNGVNQGAQYGSGVASGVGTAVNTGLGNQQTVNSSQVLGQRVFDANRKYFDATQEGQFGMSLGNGIASLGGALTANSGTINSLGQDYSARFSSPYRYTTPPPAYGW